MAVNFLGPSLASLLLLAGAVVAVVAVVLRAPSSLLARLAPFT